VSYCAVCDAFFYRGKDVAVLGSGAYALKEALDLQPLVNKITILTHGENYAVDFGYDVITHKITQIGGGASLKEITFENGDTLDAGGLFIAIGVAGGTELAKKIGAVVDENGIVVDSRLCTSVPGLWAAGDCIPGMKQIAKAVYDGAVAGTETVKYLRKL
jgi:thioredoxin reductase (NADPH)